MTVGRYLGIDVSKAQIDVVLRSRNLPADYREAPWPAPVSCLTPCGKPSTLPGSVEFHRSLVDRI
jgi:hypothetical protein